MIITVEKLGKRYRLGAGSSGQRYTALRDVITDKAKSLFRRNGPTSDLRPPTSDQFWALKDISFEVDQGEVIGIIGRNGAGKSTLLKILSRITEPTEGRVRLRGRVASLLEVGTGFHPELTGRENVFLNGAILGMTRAEIKAKFDEIVAFAEVEKFLDTPVKRYSSGMYVRLAFAVAAHLEPEILMVDEVLAVGDAEFQKKCLGKMKDVAAGEGRTVLFVSHNMAAVQALCQTALFLHEGKVVLRASASETVQCYLSRLGSDNITRDRDLSGALRLCELSSNPAVVENDRELTFQVTLVASEGETISDIALLIHASNGDRVALVDLRSPDGPYRIPAGKRLSIDARVDSMPFVEGDFDVGLYVSADSVCGSFMGLSTVTVIPAGDRSGIVPREPQFRGLVELRTVVRPSIEPALPADA